MENQETHDSNNFSPALLEIDYVQGMLDTTSKWAKFLGILGFIGVGFMVLAGLAMAAMGNSLPTTGDNPIVGMLGGGMLAALYLVMAAVYFFPSLYLYQYADKLQMAINTRNQDQLILALGKNKAFFKFVGIATVVGIAFYILFIIVFVGAVAAGGDFVTGG